VDGIFLNLRLFIKTVYKSNISWLPLLLPLILFLRSPMDFPYPSSDATFSDISISHYPNTLFLRRSLLETGTVPLWSPAILSGYPFAADPLSGLWYPPGWVVMLFPLPLGFNLLAALHLLWGGLGVFYFLRENGLSQKSALFGALAYESAPKIFAHYGAGHLTLVYAISWTPWLVWATQRSEVRKGGWKILPAVILGLICLADPRWSIFAGCLWAVYSIAYSHRGNIRSDNKKTIFTWLHALWLLIIKTINLLPTIGLALLIACPILIPLFEYVRLSSRVAMTPKDIMVFSLPPSRLLGLLFPDFRGNHEFMVYSGGVVLIFFLLSILREDKPILEKFWLWIAFLSLIYALGDFVPFFSYLARVPGFSLLRVPSRSLFLTNLATAIVAGFTVEALLKPSRIEQKSKIKLMLAFTAILALALAVGLWVMTKEIQVDFAYGALVFLVTSLLVGTRLDNRLSFIPWYIGILGLALFDWGMVDASVLSFRNANLVLSEQHQVANYLVNQDGYFRIYSPSYSLPQQVAIRAGLELADGVNPLHLATYEDYMTLATGVPSNGYQVSIPPFDSGRPDQDNSVYLPDPFLLGLLNVRFIVSEFDLRVTGLELVNIFGNTRVYQNKCMLPRAWVQPDGIEIGTEIHDARINIYMPNRIEITTSGPGLLVLSEIAYPGWKAWIDNQPVALNTTRNIFRSVPLDSGNHQITFKYQPISVSLGLGGFILGMCLVVGFLWAGRKPR
jgi:hypothetical protein